MDYKVEVETKDVLLAGTDAKIYCKLTDVNGTTTPTIWLKDSDNDCFEKGHVDLFKFTFKGSRITHPLAPLYKCKIWQNGHGSKADWDLKRITFHPHGSKEYSFTFNRCIKKDKHEECLVDGEDGVASTYQIKTHTSDIMYAKTNNTVKLNIIGSKGHTGFMTLDNKLQNVFERGTEDDFKKTRHCVGTIKKIQVQLNADNVFSDAAGDFLHLQSITISELITEQHLFFPINIWLKPNCKFEIEPRPFPKHEVQPGPQITKKYTGVITTGDKLLAGTNANVHIYLTDTKGRTTGAIRVREKGGDTMERGDKDQIAVELTGHYDDLETIGVSQDGAGAGSDWYLEKIELTEVNPITGENIGDELVFKFNEWIKTNQKVSRHFQPKVNKKYIGVIVTGDVLMAGTDANVDIYLTDKAGISTGAIRVREKGADGMEREDEDPITIELTGQYGKLETVGISQDGEGARSDWYLERIELTEVDPTSGDAISEKHIFTFQKWIKTNKTVSRSLSHKVEPIKPNNSPVQTKFTGLVVTGEDAMAGTDANVQIFLTDIQGHKTKGIMLRERGGDAMEKNSENVLYINLSQKLGPLESVEVEHDGHGPYPDWFLDRIELSEAEIATGKVKEASKKIFYFNRWIKPKTRESSFYKAPPQEPQIKTIITGYIQTADKIGAGTDAHVELWVTDAKGTTVGPLMLKEKGDAMERNQKNDIKLKILDELVPPLYKVCLRQDGHGFADAWELKKVVLSFELPVGITDKATFLYQKVLKSGKLYDMGRYNKDTEIANGPIKYEIQVITSNAEHAGTDDNVFIEIVGTKGRTGKRPLKVGKFRDGFERGQTDICKITAVNIGDYKGVILHKDGENNWRVSQVSVKTEKENFSKFVAGDKIVGPEGLKIAFSGRS